MRKRLKKKLRYGTRKKRTLSQVLNKYFDSMDEIKDKLYVALTKNRPKSTGNTIQTNGITWHLKRRDPVPPFQRESLYSIPDGRDDNQTD